MARTNHEFSRVVWRDKERVRGFQPRLAGKGVDVKHKARKSEMVSRSGIAELPEYLQPLSAAYELHLHGSLRTAAEVANGRAGNREDAVRFNSAA